MHGTFLIVAVANRLVDENLDDPEQMLDWQACMEDAPAIAELAKRRQVAWLNNIDGLCHWKFQDGGKPKSGSMRDLMNAIKQVEGQSFRSGGRTGEKPPPVVALHILLLIPAESVSLMQGALILWRDLPVEFLHTSNRITICPQQKKVAAA